MDGVTGTAYDAAVAAAAAAIPTPKMSRPGSARHGGAVGGMGGGGGGFGPGSLRYNGVPGGDQAASDSAKSLQSITSDDMNLALFSGEDVMGGVLDGGAASAVFESWA